MRYLPPLNALKAFYAASLHKNFSDAADDLNVTHGAVSRHVRQLEDILGVRLFRRLPRGVELTDDGRSLAFACQESFDILSSATERYRQRSKAKSVTISTVPSIAARWLVPRLERFQKNHPDIAINLNTSMQLLDPKTDNIDFVIRYGRGDWPGLSCELIFCKNLTTVCAPSLLDKFEPEPCYSCLKDTRLLVTDGYRYWEAFMKANGLEDLKSLSVLELSDNNVAIEAAIAGQGVALLPEVLVEKELKSGRLVKPFLNELAADFGYYLGVPVGVALSEHAKKAINWIRQEARGEEELCETCLP